MTKSIEEQAREYANNHGDGELSSCYENKIEAFIVSAKSRDAQWSAVASELREFKFKSMHFPILTTNDEAADMANRVLNELLTKANQILKEMGINL